MGGIAAALAADVLGGLLLLLGGPAAIWRTLWVFWAESAAAGIVAAARLRRGMASLSDDDWLAYAGQTLEAMERRGPSDDETRMSHAQDIARRRERLAALAALDRRTPHGAAAFAHARSTEGLAVGGVMGCAFVGFSFVHAAFLLMLGVFQGAFQFVAGGLLGGGFLDPGASPFDSGELMRPFGPDLAGASLDRVGPVVLAMALVFAVGLARLRRTGAMAEGEASVKEALTRTFILQIVLIIGSVPAIFLGSVPLAVAFVAVKTAADVYPLWRQRRAAIG
jgi:hypothetical protein